MEALREMVIKGNQGQVESRVKDLLEKDTDPEAIMKQSLIPAMDLIGDLFQKGELFVPEMLVSARAMQKGLDVLRPLLIEKGVEPMGKVVMGTVKGDLHDIGKNLVVMALEGAGFQVIDLGTDVTPERFVSAIEEYKPAVVGMSALLTTTMQSMKSTLAAIEQAGARGKVKVMVGGAPLRQEYADEIKADFYGSDSTAAKKFAVAATNGHGK